MEHILQIGVCVDDKAIEEGAMKSLVKKEMKGLKDDCLSL